MHKHAIVSEDGTRIDFNDISIESLGAHLVFGDIDEESMKAASTFILKANQLFTPQRELTLFINTNGGYCADGFALIDLMSVSRLPIKTVGMGNVISMGVLIACSGTHGMRYMTRNTQVMAHQFSGGTHGKFHELMADFKADLYLKNLFLQHFLRHTKMEEKQIEDVLFGPSDRWLTPAECKKFGIVDHVVDELPEFNLEIPARLPPRPRAGKSTPRSRK